MSRRATEALPEFVRTILDRAVALFEEGRLDNAEVLLATLANDKSVESYVLHLRGIIALHLGQKERAQQFLTDAIRADPTDAEAHSNLGVLCLETHRYPQAAAAFAAALHLDPSRPTWHFGLAKALAALGLFDLAIDGYRDAVSHAVDYADAELDLALLLADCGETGSSIATLRKVAERHPDRADLHLALAGCLFASGDWQAAWREYEWRLSDPTLVARPLVEDRPVWRGEDPAGKTLLVVCEQGYGDTLQFVRYVPMVAALGAKVVLRAPRSLVPLLRSLEGAASVIAAEDPLPPFDLEAPLLSLPGLFGTRIETIPAAVPYLSADPSLVETWRERLGSAAGLSVGLCWQGNPAHRMDHFRSVRLDALSPLLACPGIRVVSLQVGPGQDQTKGYEDRLVTPLSAVAAPSLADAAAIIAGLDLVISIDSAIAHLAGALGKPVWILLAARSDWRWLREREDTPWYPRARLFRQNTPGDWDEVVVRVRAALGSLAGPAATPGIEAAPARRPKSVDPALSDALFVEAMRHHRDGEPARSKKLLERLLALDPAHVHALCNLGALECRGGDPRRARDLLERAVALAPALAEARLALGETLLAGGKVPEALAQYRKALELAPTSAGVHAAVAMALGTMGDHVAAMAHFEEAVRIDQGQAPEFYEALGRTTMALGNLDGAEICFQHALALDPRRAPAHAGLGDVLLAMGRRVDALASYRRALDMDPRCGAARRGLDEAQRVGGKATTFPMS